MEKWLSKAYLLTSLATAHSDVQRDIEMFVVQPFHLLLYSQWLE